LIQGLQYNVTILEAVAESQEKLVQIAIEATEGGGTTLIVNIFPIEIDC
jgi:hypothetical protein